MIKCKTCKEIKEDKNFAVKNKTERKEVCKECTTTKSTYYTHPESYYNLFIGNYSWWHLYFEKTICRRW